MAGTTTRLGVRCGALLACLVAASCAGPSHIKPYQPKRRDWKPPVPIADAKVQRTSPGSLWPADGRSRVVDWGDRPALVGDVVNVRIDEYLTAKGGASTEIKRDAQYEAKIRAFLGLIEKAKEFGLDEAAIGASLKDEFVGEGSTSRENRIVATVPVMVVKVLSNGNLYIEGERVILLNDEENHFYLSGVIRPVDIDAGNIVRSSRIADAHIEVTGRGLLAQGTRPGWFSRYLGWLWPF